MGACLARHTCIRATHDVFELVLARQSWYLVTCPTCPTIVAQLWHSCACTWCATSPFQGRSLTTQISVHEIHTRSRLVVVNRVGVRLLNDPTMTLDPCNSHTVTGQELATLLITLIKSANFLSNPALVPACIFKCQLSPNCC